MKKTILGIAAAALAIGALPAAASAAPWQAMGARKVQIDRQIDQGVRSGRLTRQEAASLRSRFAGIVRLENDYRRGGLNLREQRDLDRRYDALESEIRRQATDRDHRRR